MECLNCGAQLGDTYGQAPLCRDCLRLPIQDLTITIFGGTIEEVNKRVCDSENKKTG